LIKRDSNEALIRALQLLSALTSAGVDPIRLSYAHALAYLSEALSPVWGLDVASGEILKRDGLPFFPLLQRSIDELIWRGLAEVLSFEYVKDSAGHWRTVADCRLIKSETEPLLRLIRSFVEEQSRSDLYLEIALGMARNEPIEDLFLADASYSDPRVSTNRLINLDVDSFNLSTDVAERFGRLAPDGLSMSPGQKVGLYLNHLGRVRNG
jgi:hypothetical protein